MFRLPGRVHPSARRACDNRDDVARWSDAELVAAIRALLDELDRFYAVG